MNPLRPIKHLFTEEHEARTLLVGLLLVDVVFLAGHLALAALGAEGYYDPSIEQAAGEGYQYVKWIWSALLCLHLGAFISTPRVWSCVLAYLFFDDSLGLHERAGRRIADALDLHRFEKFRAIEIGEFIYMAALALALAGLLVYSMWRASGDLRATFHPFLLLLGAVLAFGGLGDAIHAYFWDASFEEFFEIVEESGEMISLSVLTAYLYRLWSGTGTWPGRRTPA